MMIVENQLMVTELDKLGVEAVCLNVNVPKKDFPNIDLNRFRRKFPKISISKVELNDFIEKCKDL